MDRWKHHLDQQLPGLLEFGFPLDFDRACVLGHMDKNCNSAINSHGHIDKYIQEEIQCV